MYYWHRDHAAEVLVVAKRAVASRCAALHDQVIERCFTVSGTVSLVAFHYRPIGACPNPTLPFEATAHFAQYKSTTITATTMSYLLELPMRPLPYNVRSPPYVIIGIRGKEIVSDLPPRIPLNVVLHFAPKLQQWVLPPPRTTNLPWPVARFALRTPYIGIDILSDDIEPEGLKWITKRMLQASGCVRHKDQPIIHPSLLTSISIRKTWLALELPLAGIQSLDMHIHSRLMLDRAVTLPEMEAIWEAFPHGSDIVRAMGLNFVRSQLKSSYTHDEFSAMQDWYVKSEERCQFFKSLRDYFPDLVAVQDTDLEVGAEKGVAVPTDVVKSDNGKNGEDSTARTNMDVAKTKVRKFNLRRKARQGKDGGAMRTRLRRTRSDESVRSIETVIWHPPNKRNAEGETGDEEENAIGASIGYKTDVGLSKAFEEPQFGGVVMEKLLRRVPLAIGTATKNLRDLLTDENLPREDTVEQSHPDQTQYMAPHTSPSQYSRYQSNVGSGDIDTETRLQRLSRWKNRSMTPMTWSDNAGGAADGEEKEETEGELETLEVLQPSVYAPRTPGGTWGTWKRTG